MIPSLFEGDRMVLREAIDLTVESLRAYRERYDHWAIAYSGGKDSTTVVTLVAHLIDAGLIPAPTSLRILYADTRMELLPLQIAAFSVMAELRSRDIDVRVVQPPLDERFFVYMLGRGVPPPKNRFRWCTAQIKVEPMEAALLECRNSIDGKLLMLTGVRLGESAARDQRIVTSCSRDGAECGQGWFQESTPDSVADTLAPIIHWRLCHVWAWLTAHAPTHGFPTRPIAVAYGGEQAEEIAARTGCVGCPLASKDTALDSVIAQPEWAYLSPLKRLKPLYHDLSFNHANRLRKVAGEQRKDGTLVANQQRVGPLTMEARQRGLNEILLIQAEVNAAAEKHSRPHIDLLDTREEERIREMWAANIWPRNWTGDEPLGDEPVDQVNKDGSVQIRLPEVLS